MGRLQRRTVSKIARRVVSKSKESKLMCTDYTNGITLNTGVSTTTLFQIAQGDGGTTRDGNVVQPTKFRMKFCFKTAEDIPSIARVLIIQWNRGVESVELPTNYLSCIPHDAKRQYRVLYDKAFPINPTGAATEGLSPMRDISIYGKRLRRMYWDSATTTAAAADEGGKFQVIWYSNHGTATTAYADIQTFWKEV